MKPNKVFALIISMMLFLTFSCSEKNSESSANSKLQAGPTIVNKIDACSLINTSELGAILNTEVKQSGPANYLEGNEFAHYMSLCGFTTSEMQITTQVSQPKKSIDATKSRDNAFEIEKDDENNVVVESLHINGMPALYIERHDKEWDIKMNTLSLFVGEFNAAVVCDKMTKEQMIKAAGKIIERIKN